MREIKTIKLVFVILFSFFLINIALFSQTRVGIVWGKGPTARLIGKVLNENGEPLEKAIVIIPEIGKTIDTNEFGFFSISLKKGITIHLEIYKEGYVPFTTDFFKINRKPKLSFTFTLMKSLQETITVTATAVGKKLLDIPVKTYVISKQKIEDIKPINLAEALSFTTGVKVENDCQNCNYTQVRLNGLEGKYTQILVDGLPIISSLASVYGLEQIPSEMIEQIEIVKGGTSSLYGANAIGGVINIITKEPSENKTVVNLQDESIKGKQFYKISFVSNYVSRDSGTKATFFASHFKREPVDVNNDGFSNLGKLNDTSFGFNLYRSFENIGSKLKLSLAKINEYRRGGDSINKPPHEAMIAEMAKTDRMDFTLGWEQCFGQDILKLAFSYTHHERDSYYGAGKDKNAYGHTKNPLFIGIAHYYHKAGNHFFTFGLSYKLEKLMDEALGYNRIIDDKYENFGAMLQDDFEITDGFELLLGTRIDKHSKVKKTIFSPRLSLMVSFSDYFRSRTTLSTGFRAPQVFDEDLHITILGGEGFIVKNSPDLKEEKSYSLVQSFDFYKSSSNKAIQLSIGGFYNRLENTFVLEEGEGTENSRVFIRKNGKGLRVYGIEFDFGYKILKAFEFDVGWTFQKSLFDEPEPEFGSKVPFKTPENYGFATFSIDAIKGINLLFSFEYTGKMKLPHYRGYIKEDKLETTPAYYTVSSTITKRFQIEKNKVEVFLKVYNITNEFQKDIDKGPLRDAGYIYGPMKPRTFIFGIKYVM